MIKRILVFSMCLVFGVIFSAFAQGSQPEEISITTYYPSPYGQYHELSTDRLSIGATDPAADGVINFKNLSNDPVTGDRGALYYNSATDKFKYYNGSQWKDVGEQDLVWFGNFGLHLKDGATANASCVAGSITWTGQARNAQGTIQTLAALSAWPVTCSSGFQDGYNAQCSALPWGMHSCTAYATTSAAGVKIVGQCPTYPQGNCSAQGSW